MAEGDAIRREPTPKVGVGPLRFGAHPAAVTTAIGAPARTRPAQGTPGGVIASWWRLPNPRTLPDAMFVDGARDELGFHPAADPVWLGSITAVCYGGDRTALYAAVAPHVTEAPDAP